MPVKVFSATVCVYRLVEQKDTYEFAHGSLQDVKIDQARDTEVERGQKQEVIISRSQQVVWGTVS